VSGRTIVALQSGFNGGVAFVSIRRAPASIADANKLGPFDCSADQLPAWSTPNAVKAYGTAIWSKLAAHPPVRKALEYALASSQEVRPIYFLVNAAEAERFSWESLCDDNGSFLALDPRWPIGRIAESTVDQTAPALEFTPPLKLMAVLSALKVDAAAQWHKLREAVVKARANGIAIELNVVVGQEELLNEIQADIAAGTLTEVSVHPMPLDLIGFDDLLRGFAPHILHFFCHGVVGFGSAELQLGTVNDWAQGVAVASLKLPLSQLRLLPTLQRVWLVVLNCCSSGQPAGELHSIAHDLVASGVPAAVGMIEPVGAADADTFAESFYDAVFARLREALSPQSSDPFVEIDWSVTLYRPRQRLVSRHDGKPENDRQWLVPALYTQLEPFRVRRTVPGVPVSGEPPLAPLPPPAGVDAMAQRRARAETVAGMLRILPPGTPMETRREILGLLADLPSTMRPDVYGRFASGPSNTDSVVITTQVSDG
jgi:CHAT domain-containing protein